VAIAANDWLQMSRPTVLCYGQTVYQFYGLFIALVMFFKNPTYNALKKDAI